MIKDLKKIVFNQPDLGEEEMSAVMDVLRSGWIGTGKVSHQFEEEFADAMGGGYAVAVSSCTMGLKLSLKALGISYLDKIATTPLTFAATLNAILEVNGDPVLIDTGKHGCIDISKVNQAIDIKAVVPVHYSGNPCDLGYFKAKTLIVEDCAHAFGMKFRWSGAAQVFSFYANKNITCGEGGMVLTKDKALADRIRILSSQGLTRGAWQRYGGTLKTYEVQEIGYKGNMPDILAAIGLVQLRRWPEMKEKREIVFKIYEKAFGLMPEGRSTHFYPLQIENRDKVREKLHKEGIGTGIHYKPLHLEPAYKFLGHSEGDFPNAEAFASEELSLPVSSIMTKEDAIRVVTTIKGD